MPSTVISYPTPPYRNPPIEAQYYQPSRFVISGITLGVTTTVTTVGNHNYVVGNQCRLLIPNGYGSTKLSEKKGLVISVPTANTVILDLTSIYADPFIAASLPQQPQILAVGDLNSGAINASGNMATSTSIPGSFINISPN